MVKRSPNPFPERNPKSRFANCTRPRIWREFTPELRNRKSACASSWPPRNSVDAAACAH